MTRTTNPAARKLGRFLIGGGLLAVPLTGTWAVNYVDVVQAAEPAPVPASAAVVVPAAVTAPKLAVPAPPAPIKPAAAAPVAPAVPADPVIGPLSISFVGNGTVNIHGQTKRWDQLTPAERAEIRTETARARAQLNTEIARLPEQLAEARKQAERFRNGDFKREMIEARANVARSLREVESQSAALRAAGQDPEAIKAQVLASLREVERMDIDKTVRDSLASLDENKIRSDVMNAAKSLDEIDRKLDYYDHR